MENSMEYTVKAEETGRRVRDILRRSMGVSYTSMKSAKWNGKKQTKFHRPAVMTFINEG